MLPYNPNPAQIKRLRERAYCVILLVAALATAAVFLLPALLP